MAPPAVNTARYIVDEETKMEQVGKDISPKGSMEGIILTPTDIQQGKDNDQYLLWFMYGAHEASTSLSRMKYHRLGLGA